MLALDAAAREGLDPVLVELGQIRASRLAATHFAEQELAQLIAVISTVDAWNRMNATARRTPGT